mmetsp:Transcript_13148/g.15174  ORF Transcript_13148/g.15174 Transcript_13148/m.15174 type:complete len:384 (+) Transcript_13148:239-1390(+)
MASWEVPSVLLAFAPTILITGAVLSQSKHVGALVSMGDVVSRSDKIEGVALKSDKARHDLVYNSHDMIKDIDKLVFTVSCLDIALAFFWLGRSPETFYVWYSLNVPFLTYARYVLFKGQGRHYYLFDYCYFANALGLFYIFLTPKNATVFQLLFVSANGPLAWSVLAFNNSLVLHSFQHIISLCIHTAPMMLTHSLRWQGNSDAFVVESTAVNSSPAAMVWRGLLLFYLPWVFIYYTLVFVYLGDRIKKHGYETLFEYITKQAVGKQLLNLPDNTDKMLIRKAVYLSIHVLFGIVGMSFASLMYTKFLAHTSFTVAVGLAAAWNGAGFYGKVFATKYHFRNFNAILEEQRKSLRRLSASKQYNEKNQIKRSSSRKRQLVDEDE